MTTLNLETIKDLYYTDLVYETHLVQDKINCFTSKYKTDFESFERLIKSKDSEVFGEWDDYIEWKGLQTALVDLNSKRKDLENGDIKVA